MITAAALFDISSVRIAVIKYNSARTTMGPQPAKGFNIVFTSQRAVPLCCIARPKGRTPPSRKIIFQSIASYASSMVRHRLTTMPTAPISAAARIGIIFNTVKVTTARNRIKAIMTLSLRTYSSVNSFFENYFMMCINSQEVIMKIMKISLFAVFMLLIK